MNTNKINNRIEDTRNGYVFNYDPEITNLISDDFYKSIFEFAEESYRCFCPIEETIFYKEKHGKYMWQSLEEVTSLVLEYRGESEKNKEALDNYDMDILLALFSKAIEDARKYGVAAQFELEQDYSDGAYTAFKYLKFVCEVFPDLIDKAIFYVKECLDNYFEATEDKKEALDNILEEYHDFCEGYGEEVPKELSEYIDELVSDKEECLEETGSLEKIINEFQEKIRSTVDATYVDGAKRTSYAMCVLFEAFATAINNRQ